MSNTSLPRLNLRQSEEKSRPCGEEISPFDGHSMRSGAQSGSQATYSRRGASDVASSSKDLKGARSEVNFTLSAGQTERRSSIRAEMSESGASRASLAVPSRSQSHASLGPESSLKSMGTSRSLKAGPSMSRFSMPGRMALADLTEDELAMVQEESMAKVAGITIRDRSHDEETSKSRLTRANLDELSQAPPLVLPRIKSARSRKGFLAERSSRKASPPFILPLTLSTQLL